MLESPLGYSPCDRLYALWSVPDLYCAITTSRGNALTIRRPGHCPHKTGMPSIGEGVTPICSIPDLHGVITTPRGNALTTGGPGHRIHRSGMPSIGVRRKVWSKHPIGNSTTDCDYSSCDQTDNYCTTREPASRHGLWSLRSCFLHGLRPHGSGNRWRV